MHGSLAARHDDGRVLAYLTDAHGRSLRVLSRSTLEFVLQSSQSLSPSLSYIVAFRIRAHSRSSKRYKSAGNNTERLSRSILVRVVVIPFQSGIIGESLQLMVPVDGPTMITRLTYTTSNYHSPLVHPWSLRLQAAKSLILSSVKWQIKPGTSRRRSTG